ncbi:MAG: FAD/NAD(P)-binding protein [Deltaproteobacteria bacterium]|nr:FAD/NAD(P)-binding protein [Deltaproteobacteria bacterium]
MPHPAEIIEKRQENENTYTFRLRFCEEEVQRHYRFLPGQFNMLYAFGVGEVPITLVSDPMDTEFLDHTIRIVGNVTQALARLHVGDKLGLRGPFGSAWPLDKAQGHDVLVLTGGLGCAPSMGAIRYIMRHRSSYGKLAILHGVKAPSDLIYQKKFLEWGKIPNTEVFLSADQADRTWKHKVGLVTHLLDQVNFDAGRVLVMMCGPEIMMRFAVKECLVKGIQADAIYLALERNMKCALGFCGHCQLGPQFICKDGPVLCYDKIKNIFDIKEV